MLEPEVRVARVLMNALFSDGLSTAVEVTGTSGRGVGMAAARQACDELGGKVCLRSQAGEGTASPRVR